VGAMAPCSAGREADGPDIEPAFGVGLAICREQEIEMCFYFRIGRI